MKKHNLYPKDSLEYVFLHGLWRKKRGKNFSATLPFLNIFNPAKAFKIVSPFFNLESKKSNRLPKPEHNFVNSIGRSYINGKRIKFEDEFGNDYVDHGDDGY
jgi:hypothetical protein